MKKEISLLFNEIDTSTNHRWKKNSIRDIVRFSQQPLIYVYLYGIIDLSLLRLLTLILLIIVMIVAAIDTQLQPDIIHSLLSHYPKGLKPHAIIKLRGMEINLV